MRGGTVLHKAHLAPAARYSEDIDLVLVKAMDMETLDRKLYRVLAPVLGRPGLPKFDVDEGAEIVRKAYVRHLNR